mgnify:CR=1 FL=1
MRWRCLVAAAMFVAFVPIASAAPRQAPKAQKKPPTRTIETTEGVTVPVETGAGVWDGTYVFSCRDFKIALWMQTRGGAPEMKLHYVSLQNPESFETDWAGLLLRVRPSGDV